MKWVLLFLLFLTVLAILIILTKMTILLEYFHGNDNDDLSITVKAWGGLIKYKMNFPVIKIDDNSPTIVAEEKVHTGHSEKVKKEKVIQEDKTDIMNSLKDIQKLVVHVTGLHKIIRQFLKRVTIRQVQWHSVIGIGDAALTGVITGAVWAIKSSLIGIISHYMKLKDMPAISVTPSFQQMVSQTSLKCMFQVRIGHAILAAMKLVKYWKGGWPEFKTRPLSVLSGDKTNSV